MRSDFPVTHNRRGIKRAFREILQGFQEWRRRAITQQRPGTSFQDLVLVALKG
jgi:hypothetical protein